VTADKKEFSEKLIEDFLADRTYSVYLSIDPYLNGWGDPGLLTEILGIPESRLSNDARMSLELLESTEKNNVFRDEWIDFKRKLIAYREIQDIFPMQLHYESSPMTAMRLWYFYFEADYLMKDSLLAGFHYCGASSVSTLRPFLEFTALQLYYYRVTLENGNLKRLEDYHATERQPGWHAALKASMPNDNFCKPIRKRVQLHLSDLSNHSSHPHGHTSSPRNQCYSPGVPHMTGLAFWRLNRLVLEAALWVYYVNFPMLFKPTNVYSKFGCNRPMGHFADNVCSSAVEHALNPQDFKIFSDYAAKDEGSNSEVDWIESRDDLTKQELRESCDDDFSGSDDEMYPGAYLMATGKARSLRAMLSLDTEGLKSESKRKLEELPDINIHDFHRWRVAYKDL